MIMNNSVNTEKTVETQQEYIVRQATEMFVDQGVKAVRMDDIAHELGVSKRTMYEMFADKKDLLIACLKRHFDRCNEAMHESVSQAENVVEEIILIIRVAYQVSERSRMFMQSVAKYYPDLYEPFKLNQAEIASAKFREMLSRGIAEGVFQPDMNIEFTEAVFSMTLNGVASSTKVSLPQGVTMKDAMSYIITNFFRGLSTTKGLKMVDEYRRKYQDLYIKIHI